MGQIRSSTRLHNKAKENQRKSCGETAVDRQSEKEDAKAEKISKKDVALGKADPIDEEDHPCHL
ncbi:MAG: hypothetical protein V1711_01685 [bacterium]